MPTVETHIRSEAVQDILTKVPHWMIRWGNTIICSLLLLFFVFSWLIKYPDVIAAKALLTTQVPPQKEFAVSSGKLQHIFVENAQKVIPGQDLAMIENTANYDDVNYLKNILDTLTYTKERFDFPITQIPLLFLGEIDAAYTRFENSYLEYDYDRKNLPFNNKIQSQELANQEFNIRLRTLRNQQSIQNEELRFLKLDLERDELLYNQGAISLRDFEQKQLKYLQAERNFQNLTNSISQLKEMISTSKMNFSLEDNINKSEKIRLLRSTIQSFNQLKKAIYDWEMRYVLRSEINGTISFLDFWSVNQQVNSGDLLFTIVPEENKSYLAKLKVPAFNSGKLTVGQQVYLNLDNYPEAEYGKIEGRVSSISAIPDAEGNYLVDAELPERLITTYSKDIEFQSEMLGNAEIITEDLRLLERFFYQFRSIINN